MKPLVVDASMVAAWFLEDEKSLKFDAVLEAVRRDGARVPAHWHWEVANLFLVAERRRRIAQREVGTGLDMLWSLPIETDRAFGGATMRETIALARAHKLTAYDAAYLELAIRHGAELATLDSDLRAAARATGVGLA